MLEPSPDTVRFADTLFRSDVSAGALTLAPAAALELLAGTVVGMIPLEEWIDERSALVKGPDKLGREGFGVCDADEGDVAAAGPALSVVCERVDRGRDSREPPHCEDGAMARTDALVSTELRRRLCWDDEARVTIEALSVS